MYNDVNFNNSDRPQRAYEIDLHVRELEKKYALMNAINRSNTSTDLLSGVKKTTRRIASLIGTLFLG